MSRASTRSRRSTAPAHCLPERLSRSRQVLAQPEPDQAINKKMTTISSIVSPLKNEWARRNSGPFNLLARTVVLLCHSFAAFSAVIVKSLQPKEACRLVQLLFDAKKLVVFRDAIR